jgi:hypothetical protein
MTRRQGVTKLEVGQWVRIAAVPETDREKLAVADGTVGVIDGTAETLTYGVPHHFRVDGQWYYADELTPVPSYAELEQQWDKLLAACEQLDTAVRIGDCADRQLAEGIFQQAVIMARRAIASAKETTNAHAPRPAGGNNDR